MEIRDREAFSCTDVHVVMFFAAISAHFDELLALCFADLGYSLGYIRGKGNDFP